MTSKPKAKAKVKEIELTAVGLHYRLTPSKLAKLEDSLPLQCELRREPENEYDENAIAVWCVERPFREVKIGYLAKQVAHDLAPMMDVGKFSPHEVWASEIHVSKSGVGGNGHVATLLVKV